MGTDRHLTRNQKSSTGFTIVELLIVVVVIAILAAITIVAYNGITNRANQSALQETIKQVATKLELYKVDNSSYPTSLGALNADQLLYGNPALRWAYTASTGSYFLSVGSATASAMYYNISDTTGSPQAGLAAGHTADMLTAGYPSRGGFTDITNATYPGDNTEVQIGSIPTGAWIIVIFAYSNGSDPVPPSGWTVLFPRHVTNTLNTFAYGKMKQAGDANQQLFNAAGVAGEPTVNGLVLWGTGSANIPAWTIGAFGDRASNATSTTTLTPTVTTTIAKSLVLSISTERTIATETNYVSLTGVTPWAWVPQVDADKMHTIAVGYEEKASPGVSRAMIVTYPNVQATNGAAVQVVIPPAS